MRKETILLSLSIASVLLVICTPVQAQDEEELPVIVINEPAVIEEPIMISENQVESDPYAEENALIEEKIKEAQKEMAAIEHIDDPYAYYQAYIDIVEKYIDWIDPPETIFDYYTDDEIELMWKVIETETHGADFESKCHVANVLLNRVESEHFPDDINEIIVPGQFAYSKSSITPETKMALEYAFMFGDKTQGALFFHSGSKTNTFNGAEYLFTDDAGHHFYTKEEK